MAKLIERAEAGVETAEFDVDEADCDVQEADTDVVRAVARRDAKEERWAKKVEDLQTARRQLRGLRSALAHAESLAGLESPADASAAPAHVPADAPAPTAGPSGDVAGPDPIADDEEQASGGAKRPRKSPGEAGARDTAKTKPPAPGSKSGEGGGSSVAGGKGKARAVDKGKGREVTGEGSDKGSAGNGGKGKGREVALGCRGRPRRAAEEALQLLGRLIQPKAMC